MTVLIEINFFRGKAVNVNVYCFSLITVNNVGACFLEVIGMYCISFLFTIKGRLCRDG